MDPNDRRIVAISIQYLSVKTSGNEYLERLGAFYNVRRPRARIWGFELPWSCTDGRFRAILLEHLVGLPSMPLELEQF